MMQTTNRNREMYMNCALVNINNPNTSVLALTTPEIFKANIGQYGAFATVEGADVRFPDPGDSRDESLGDRQLNEPLLLDQGSILLPAAAPEVGTVQRSPVAISKADDKHKMIQLKHLILIISISLILIM